MAQETFLRDATLFQLTEILISKSDQVYLQLERLLGRPRSNGSHTVGGAPLGFQHIGQPESKNSTSSCELVNTLWTAVSRISSSVNETRPVSRLPPEVLTEVFGWYQRLESQERDKWYTWVRLMLVSHGWRSTILSFPSLWSRAYLSGEIPPEVIRMSLQRSGGHPLDVIIPFSYPPTPKFVRNSHMLSASEHAPRIRKFILEDYGRINMNHLVEVFSRPAPDLTYLELCSSESYGTKPFPSLFGLEFPRLRELKVTGIEAWPKIAGANLTHVTVRSSLDPHSLSRCLPYSPNLKALKLLNIRNSLNKQDAGTWQRIALPPGIHLTIWWSMACPDILELFSLPQDCHLEVRPSIYDQEIPELPLLSYVLPGDVSPFQNLHTLTRLHIKAYINICAGLELKCFRIDRPAFEVNVRYSPKIPTMVEGSDTPAMWFLGNLQRIVLRGVEELRMEGFVGRFEPKAIELLLFLKRMPALTKLVTADGNEEIFRSALDNLGCRAIVVREEV